MDTFRSRTTPNIYLGLEFRQICRAGGHFDGKSTPKEFAIVLGRHCGYVDCWCQLMGEIATYRRLTVLWVHRGTYFSCSILLKNNLSQLNRESAKFYNIAITFIIVFIIEATSSFLSCWINTTFFFREVGCLILIHWCHQDFQQSQIGICIFTRKHLF
jgi:hypothetical protein